MPLTARSLESHDEEMPELILAKAEPFLAELPDWEVDLEEGELRKQFRFADFAATIRFVGEIAKLPEAEEHPPDLAIHYDVLDITLTTPAVSGLTVEDFALAARIEKLPR